METSGFEIDGAVYPVPTVDTLTIGEERLLYLYADVVLRHLAPAPSNLEPNIKLAWEAEQARRLDAPDFKRAWAIIAYRRKHPEAALVDVEKVVDASNALQFELTILAPGDDVDPPEQSSLKQPGSMSESSEPKASIPSGDPSTSASELPSEGMTNPTSITPELQDTTPETTGPSESETSSPGALRIASAR